MSLEDSRDGFQHVYRITNVIQIAIANLLFDTQFLCLVTICLDTAEYRDSRSCKVCSEITKDASMLLKINVSITFCH